MNFHYQIFNFKTTSISEIDLLENQFKNIVEFWENPEKHDDVLEFISMASEKGHQPSQIFLINLFLNDEIDVTGDDLDNLVNYCEIISEKNSMGFYLLAKIFQKVEKNDKTKYLENLKKGFEKGDTRSIIELGEYYKSIKEFKKSFEMFEIGSNKGDACCQYQIGMMYYYGEGVEQNDSKSLEFFKLSAKSEYTESEYRLGVYYLLIETDQIELGIEYLKKASKKGNKDAKDLLNSYNHIDDEIDV